MRRFILGLLLPTAALALSVLAQPVGALAAPRQHRLPPDYKWGQCLLEVEGKRYISGRCAYQVSHGGSFEIQGPKQIYSGIDYPEPAVFTGERSTDYFAQVDVDPDGAEAFWNADVRATHAQAHLGPVTRRGACWVNAHARICLWK